MKTPTHPDALTEAIHADLLGVTHDVRTWEGEGGQCGFVATDLAKTYGWVAYGGIYHSEDGRPIGDHVWNVHVPTGTIIDATADQFGEGDGVRVLTPTDPLHARYRHAESEEQEDEWLDIARAATAVHGGFWWVPGGAEAPAVVAYLARVMVYRAGR